LWERLFAPADFMQKGLAASWTRDAVIRNNIANVETPGFKASDLVFEDLLAQALVGSGFKGVKTNERHIDIGPYRRFKGAKTRDGHIDIGEDPEVAPMIVERYDTSMRMDENNVDIEGENVRLAQNTLFYNTLLEKLNGELRRLRLAITEGR